MPLSEQEQRLLEEMERSLYHNDADFVAGSSGRHGRPTYTTIVTGVLIGVVGVATLIAGVGVRLPIVGVLGFILMFAGVLIALTPPRSSGAGSTTPRATSASGQTGSFPQNSDDEWQNRPDDQDE
jgi:Protein of unknown function (DUF3040)